MSALQHSPLHTLTVRCRTPEHATDLSERLETLGVDVETVMSNLVLVPYDDCIRTALKVASTAVAGGFADPDDMLALLDLVEAAALGTST